MEQMDRMEGKKKQKKETKIYENDVVMHEELFKAEVMKSEDSEDFNSNFRPEISTMLPSLPSGFARVLFFVIYRVKAFYRAGRQIGSYCFI